MAEAEAVEGVVPKWNDDNTIRAFVIYGEGTFLVPKRSLINKARRNAEKKANRAFAEWMKQSLESETVIADMLEQDEVTDEQGNTSGKARELTSQIDVMRTNTKAVLSGIIKLDECLDTEERVIYVELGWKPTLSEAAGDAAATIKKETERGEASTSNDDDTASAESGESTKGSKSKKAKGYRKKSKAKDNF